jgi:hypothetical protein
MNRLGIIQEAKRIYGLYQEELQRRHDHAPAWDDIGPSFRQLWRRDVEGVIAGGMARHPESWVRELVFREAQPRPTYGGKMTEARATEWLKGIDAMSRLLGTLKKEAELELEIVKSLDRITVALDDLKEDLAVAAGLPVMRQRDQDSRLPAGTPDPRD